MKLFGNQRLRRLFWEVGHVSRCPIFCRLSVISARSTGTIINRWKICYAIGITEDGTRWPWKLASQEKVMRNCNRAAGTCSLQTLDGETLKFARLPNVMSFPFLIFSGLKMWVVSMSLLCVSSSQLKPIQFLILTVFYNNKLKTMWNF